MLDQKFSYAYALGDNAAGTDRTIYLFRAPVAIDIKAIYVTVSTTLAADAADYVTITLLQGANTIGSLATSSTGFTGGTPRAMTLTEANTRVTAGTAVKLTIVNTGSTGAALDEVVVQIDGDPYN